MRFIFRLLAMIALAVAVVMAVLDATRTVAASVLTMTPLGESWRSVSPQTLEGLKALADTRLHPALWDPVLVWLLGLPGFAVFGSLALVLFAAGHRPARPAGRFSVGG